MFPVWIIILHSIGSDCKFNWHCSLCFSQNNASYVNYNPFFLFELQSFFLLLVQPVSLIDVIHIIFLFFLQMYPVWIIILLSVGSACKFDWHYSNIICLFLTKCFLCELLSFFPLVQLVSLINIIHIFVCFFKMLPVWIIIFSSIDLGSKFNWHYSYITCFLQMLPVWIVILLFTGSACKFNWHYLYIICLFLTNVACVNCNTFFYWFRL